jgi:molybdate transport system substrate-binding protein
MRFLLALCLLLAPLAARAQVLTVFAAASLTDAMKDVSAQWAQAGHPQLRLSFGSSSTLARQIDQGAPANLLPRPTRSGWTSGREEAIVPDTRKDLLGNDLVLVVAADKPKRHLGRGRHAACRSQCALRPVIRARWSASMPNSPCASLAVGRGRTRSPCVVCAALLLVERGEAPAGIVYATDAAVSKAAWSPVFPANSHDRCPTHCRGQVR